MATGRAVSQLTELSEDGTMTSSIGSKTLTKRDSVVNQSSNSSKLPNSNANVQITSSLSSIDTFGAKQNPQSPSSSHRIESNINSQVTTSTTSTDSDDESEQDNDDNAPNKSFNLPKSIVKNIPTQTLLPTQSSPCKNKSTSNNSHDRASRRMKHFQKLFKSVLKDQMPELIDSYVCAYQGDILLQGKMYITDRYLCFHSRIISYVTKHVHPWNQIERVTKERVAFIFPTAIGIKLKSPEKKLTYASFLQRDQAFEKILSIWSPFHCDSSSLSNNADDDEQRYASSLPTSKSTNPSTNNRKKSNDDLFYEAVDQFEQDPVIKLCFTTDKDQQKKKTKRRRREKNNDDDEDLSTSKQSHRKSPINRHLLIDEPTIKRQTSPNKSSSHHLSTNNSVDKSLIGRPSTLISHSDSSRDRFYPELSIGNSSPNSSTVTSNSNRFLIYNPHYLLLSFISLIKRILHYCIFLYNQWKISPMKISLVLLFFLLILILHSLYLIKLACRIEHRLQSLHNLWPTAAATSMHKSLPTFQ